MLPIFLVIGLMEWIVGLRYLFGWKRFPLFGCFGYVKMIKCLILKLFSYAGYLPVQYFAPLMVVSSVYGEPRSIDGCVYTVEGHGERVYYPTWVEA
jgi:hypothetical protein